MLKAIDGVSNATAAARATANARSAQGPDTVFRALTALGRKSDPQDPQTVRQAAVQLMSELFLKPLLAEMRRFPLGRDLAVGGQVESIFGDQLDQQLADRVAGSDAGLLKQMIRQLQARVAVPGEHSAGDDARAARNALSTTRGEA